MTIVKNGFTTVFQARKTLSKAFSAGWRFGSGAIYTIDY